MGRRSHTQSLQLFMNGEPVGQWLLTPQGEELHYAKSWLDFAARRPISLRFPLTPNVTPYKGAAVHHYFENLLPDTKPIRERLARHFRVGALDAFSLLKVLGSDCVGALQIVPGDVIPPQVHMIDMHPMSDSDVARLLRSTVNGSAGLGSTDADDEFRISLAGAQEKTALLWHQGQWCRPLGATPTTHIFKLPLGLVGNMRADMRTSVENEWLCSKILAAFGVPVAHCDIASFEGQKVLVVERFDRRLAENKQWYLRLPQEDMCQATATSYLYKYQSEGGPGIDRIMDLLRTSANAENDRRIFFTCQIIFWLLAATDGHAKNFSIRINAGGTYVLTPVYDVLSVYPIMGNGPNHVSPHRAKLAMGVKGGKNMHYPIRDIARRHWNMAAARNGLAAGGEDIIADLIARTPAVIARVQAQLPADFPARVADPIFLGLQQAANLLAQQASASNASDHADAFD
jgi:serine/threonine-protein kinase HipA